MFFCIRRFRVYGADGRSAAEQCSSAYHRRFRQAGEERRSNPPEYQGFEHHAGRRDAYDMARCRKRLRVGRVEVRLQERRFDGRFDRAHDGCAVPERPPYGHEDRFRADQLEREVMLRDRSFSLQAGDLFICERSGRIGRHHIECGYESVGQVVLRASYASIPAVSRAHIA